MSTLTTNTVDQDKFTQELNYRNTLKPDLSHRLVRITPSADKLSGVIKTLTLRAEGILRLLTQYYEDDDEKFYLSNDQLYGAVESVILDIEDIRAVVKTFEILYEHEKA